MPPTLPFTTPEGPWIGATYIDVDTVTTEVIPRDDNVRYALLGRQPVGDGQVWFVGFNLFYLLNTTVGPETSAAVVDYLLADIDVDRNLTLPVLTVDFSSRSITCASRRGIT